jgi:trehalose utilization protein
MTQPVRVLVWNEHRHEKTDPAVASIYPDGIHAALASGLAGDDLEVMTGTLDEPDQGLRRLDEADVLVWWGHAAHDEVLDINVDRIQARVLEGMGLVALHSAHYSKIFRRLMGTRCSLKWREADDHERLWVVAPDHPIADELGEYFEIEREEMYGEYFDIPTPERIVFIGWFTGGEVFRSGVTYTRGRGRIFYFQPGHETYPTYHHPQVQLVIRNAVRWAAAGNGPQPTFGNRASLEAARA